MKITFAVLIFAISLSFLTVCVSQATAADASPSPYDMRLKKFHIEPNEASVIEYLNNLHPSEEQVALAKQLVAQLNDDDYLLREKAMKQLIAMPSPPLEALAKTAANGNPEQAWRAQYVLSTTQKSSADVLFTIMKVIEANEYHDATEPLIKATPLLGSVHQQRTVEKVLAAVAQPSHAPMLRTQLNHELASVRAAALVALAGCLKEDAETDLISVADDSDERVRFLAATSLANVGSRTAIEKFIKLLTSNDLNYRTRAHLSLEEFTEHEIDFVPQGTEAERSKSIANWQAWNTEHGETVELHFPLKFNRGRSYLHGNTLLAFGYQNKIVEYDPSGKEVWTAKVGGVWSAEKLPSGNVLAAAYNEGRVVVLDPDGKIVWEYKIGNPLNARYLANGNYLISGHGSQRVVEVSPSSEVVWEFETKSLACDAHRLPNGNTLIASGSSVWEVNPEKEKVWTYEPSGSLPYGIEPLENGNVLVCDLNKAVKEITREKKVVWEYTDVSNPVDAYRLPNGNTLITDTSKFVEVTPDKRVVWKKDGCNYGTARR